MARQPGWQVRWRRRRLPPLPGAEPEALAYAKDTAVNRMLVYDRAPKRIRRACQEKGERPLEVWWDTLSGTQQERVLRGRPPGRKEWWEK